MAEVRAQAVAALRKRTGAGMMDCKRALEATAGDEDAAVDWLRTQGLAGAGKRSGRRADQGAVDVVVVPGRGAVVELRCETDFVAKGAEFTSAVSALAALVAEQGAERVEELPFDGATVGEAIAQLGARVGEKVGLGRVVRFTTTDGLIDGYRHVQNERGTIGVLVELAGVDPADGRARDVAHDIALHVASAAPRFVERAEVPAEVVEQERALLTELTRNEGKPEAAIPKIVDGRIQGLYKEQVLLDQGFVRDPRTPVRELLAGLGEGVAVRRFARVKVGEE